MLFCNTNIFRVSEKSIVSIFMVEESYVRVKRYGFRGASARAADHYWFHQSVYPDLAFAEIETFSPSAPFFFPGDGCSRLLQNVSIYPSI
jgi:hypothetical protein